jgi:hypothetical protein
LLLIVKYLIGIMTCLSFAMLYWVLEPMIIPKNAFGQENLLVSLHTDNAKYVAGTPIRIIGNIIGKTSIPQQPLQVIIKIDQLDVVRYGFIKEPQPPPTNRSGTFLIAFARNGTFSVLTTLPPVPGNYLIEGGVAPGLAPTVQGSVQIEIQELFFTRPAFMLYIGGGIGFIGLLLIILKAPTPSKDEKKRLTQESRSLPQGPRFGSFFANELSESTYTVLRFIFLTIIVATLIIAFSLTDVQISPNSPLGLIIRTGNGNNTQFDNQWVVNIGGIAFNNYSSGIQIPISVVIFGILGGYLRFLYSTSIEEERKKTVKEPFFESLKDLALFFLAPLLAVATWLLLYQGGTTSIFTLAVVSFSVGLVTREVVAALILFVRTRISPEASNSQKNSGQNSDKSSGSTSTEHLKTLSKGQRDQIKKRDSKLTKSKNVDRHS